MHQVIKASFHCLYQIRVGKYIELMQCVKKMSLVWYYFELSDDDNNIFKLCTGANILLVHLMLIECKLVLDGDHLL